MYKFILAIIPIFLCLLSCEIVDSEIGDGQVVRVEPLLDSTLDVIVFENVAPGESRSTFLYTSDFSNVTISTEGSNKYAVIDEDGIELINNLDETITYKLVALEPRQRYRVVIKNGGSSTADLTIYVKKMKINSALLGSWYYSYSKNIGYIIDSIGNVDSTCNGIDYAADNILTRQYEITEDSIIKHRILFNSIDSISYKIEKTSYSHVEYHHYFWKYCYVENGLFYYESTDSIDNDLILKEYAIFNPMITSAPSQTWVNLEGQIHPNSIVPLISDTTINKSVSTAGEWLWYSVSCDVGKVYTISISGSELDYDDGVKMFLLDTNEIVVGTNTDNYSVMEVACEKSGNYYVGIQLGFLSGDYSLAFRGF